MADWSGVFVFPPTAMDDAGSELDLRRYREHLSWLVGAGVHGVVPLGSTGEFAYLSAEERRQVIDATVEEVGGRVPVIAGVSAIATRDAVAYAREAEALGADAVLVLVQSYFGLSEDEILRHFVSIRDGMELPIFIYNNPWSSHHDIDADLAERLVDVAGVTGFKESTGGLDRVMELAPRMGDRLVLHCGWEHLALPMFLLGVRGWSNATANLVPEQCVDLYRLAVEERDFEGALVVHERIAPLAKTLLELPLAPAVKAALDLLDRPVGAPRPPLSPLSPAAMDTLRRSLDHAQAVEGADRSARAGLAAEGG